jgi:hypothetical protein
MIENPKTTFECAQNLNEAGRNFVLELARAFKIDRLVEYFNTLLNKMFNYKY